MTLEDRLRQMVTALPHEASVMLPVSVVRCWLDEEGNDPLDDLTVAQVATKLGRSESTVRTWIRSEKLETYWLGNEYRITRSALASFRDRRREQPRPPKPTNSPSTTSADLGAWRKVHQQRSAS
jgi:excisionase family DNA binding protein